VQGDALGLESNVGEGEARAGTFSLAGTNKELMCRHTAGDLLLSGYVGVKPSEL